MLEGRQIDLSAQVERVKRKTRPWRAIIALMLAAAAGVVSHNAYYLFHASDVTYRAVRYSMAAAFCFFGSVATYSLAGKARELLEPKAGISHSAVVRYAILLVGAFTTLIITLVLFGIPVGQLVLGGALTSVFVGIAAQQALGNVFAGLVLMLARPFHIGEAVRLRAGSLGGTIDGVVFEIGITYVRIDTGGTVVAVPNSQVLSAVVGPIPPDPSQASQQPERPAAPLPAGGGPQPAGSTSCERKR